MTASEKSHEIANKFSEYVDTGDKRLIENYSLGELKKAKHRYRRDSYKEFYNSLVSPLSG